MGGLGFGLVEYNFLSHLGFGMLGLSYACKQMHIMRFCLVKKTLSMLSFVTEVKPKNTDHRRVPVGRVGRSCAF